MDQLICASLPPHPLLILSGHVESTGDIPPRSINDCGTQVGGGGGSMCGVARKEFDGYCAGCISGGHVAHDNIWFAGCLGCGV